MSEKPFWYPDRADGDWCARLRADYPEHADLSDEELMEEFNPEGWKYADTWDHLGDAREDWEHLADAYLELEARLEDIRLQGRKS